MKVNLIPTLFVKQIIRISFWICCLIFPVNKDKITFASYRSSKLDGNLLFVYNEMFTRHPDYTYQFLIKKFNSSFLGKLDYILHMIKSSYALATSRYFIIDDFYFPVYLVKLRNGTEVVQLWHAAGAFKKFGLSTMDKTFGTSAEYLKVVNVHSNYSRVYVSSKNVKPFYAEAFGMSTSNIKNLGVPRTDFFYNNENKELLLHKFKQLFPRLGDKKLILYAPTFRGKSHYQDDFISPIDFPLLKELVGKDYAIIVHLHPYMRMGKSFDIGNDDFSCHVEGEFTVEELMLIADILITDYSSVIFDYSLLGRPIGFFANDLEEYTRERDFYYDYQSFIPGPLLTDTRSLADWLVNKEFDFQKVKEFRDLFFDYQDGRASARIVDDLLKKD
ncbi:CDP-glycerol glycerophosphotransferase family protein [Bacillus sp. 31A1R]|uniref:CDP-glycerol glycerophosphotransferase family protein n=1 Tax=Robertmurraya mangrovi TaxID=3098077 RepID=A0ABU5IXP9_9BACI|nr:CDP-glycerol glycerophosphotransferase family protein [Bacillus sp. 31A1R]MDZ5471924.1 CDP-glycerol glycerophosphotransferase family protein [Bacillus sp. 31A1R]